MASVTPRTDDQGHVIGWQERIRKKGYPLQVKTFRSKTEARSWAKAVESEMERVVWRDRAEVLTDHIPGHLENLLRERIAA